MFLEGVRLKPAELELHMSVKPSLPPSQRGRGHFHFLVFIPVRRGLLCSGLLTCNYMFSDSSQLWPLCLTNSGNSFLEASRWSSSWEWSTLLYLFTFMASLLLWGSESHFSGAFWEGCVWKVCGCAFPHRLKPRSVCAFECKELNSVCVCVRWTDLRLDRHLKQ